MSSCKLVIKDQVNVKFENLDLKWRQRLHQKFKYQVPYAYHLPAVKLGRWDGKIAFFGLGGTTYLYLVDQILPILEDGGVYVELEDQRPKTELNFTKIDKNYLSNIKWPSNHPHAGKPIVLRDYQVETINKFIANVESRIYANLSKQLVDNMFGEGCTTDCATSGTAEVEGSQIYWIKDTSSEMITLTITDPTGTVSTLTVPVGDFIF